MTTAFCWTNNSERCSLFFGCSHGVVTIRTYSNPAEAAMAKSLLDSHDIFCRLADENANLYGGGPLAMPIRLLVAEDQAQEAARILETKGPGLPEDFDPGTPIELQGKKEDATEQILAELRALRYENQWMMVVGIILLTLVIYLAFEIPRHTNPWSRVQEAVRRYDYQRALDLARKIVSEHPDDYYGHEYLGHIYYQMGNLDQAEREYSKALEVSLPHSLEAKLEAIRARRDHQSHFQPTATPLPPISAPSP
jgi:tetratricopeptide (TPR) repeat protein